MAFCSFQHYTIRNLEVYTQYLVSLQVFNPAGRGPSVVVPVMTDEGIPSAPQNLTADKVTQSSVLLHWAEPAQPNGSLSIAFSTFHMLTYSRKGVFALIFATHPELRDIRLSRRRIFESISRTLTFVHTYIHNSVITHPLRRTTWLL